MKRAILALGILALLLAGCGGDFASPTTTTTTTYTTTTTAAAELSQDNTKALCVGLLNIGSCNTVAVQSQSVNRPAGSPAPVANGMSGAGVVGTLVLLCLGFVFVVGAAAAVMGSGGYN